ncbi:MAG: hypothetical protein AAF735_00135 [Myxococcota bacterium]
MTINVGVSYHHVALVKGNDARLSDVGLPSKLPIGAVTTHSVFTRWRSQAATIEHGRDHEGSVSEPAWFELDS